MAISIDCVNAFNSIKRETIVNSLKANPGLSPIYRLAALSLGRSKICITENGKTHAILSSNSGVRQGSVLGPILFCLGLQPVLNRIVNTTSSKIIAYMDDILIVNSSFIEAQQTLDALTAMLQQIGLQVNRNKTHSLFSPSSFTIGGTKIINEGVIAKSLGAAMYQQNIDPAILQDWVTNRMMRMDPFFLALSRCPLSAPHAMVLLRNCALGKANFLLRTHPGEATLQAASWFDLRVEQCVKRYIGEDITDMAMSLYRLPCAKGGLGLRSQVELVDVAYNAAVAALNLGGNNQQQREVSQQLDELFETQLRTSMSVEECIHLNSIQQSSVASFALTIRDEVFKYAIRSRGLLPTTPFNSSCKCGASATTDHLYRCAAAPRERIGRHDVVKRILAAAAEKRFSTRIEPILCDDLMKKRPDLLILTPEGEVAVDVSIIYSVVTPPQKAATLKHQKYKYITENGSVFIPFIVTHCGAFHEECEDLFRIVAPSLEERSELKQSIITAVLNWNFKICRALCPTQIGTCDDDEILPHLREGQDDLPEDRCEDV